MTTMPPGGPLDAVQTDPFLRSIRR